MIRMVHMVANPPLRPHSILSMEKVVNEGMVEESSNDGFDEKEMDSVQRSSNFSCNINISV